MSKKIIPLKFKFSSGQERNFEVHIDDGIALTICKDDETATLKLYDAEHATNPNLFYDPSQKALIEKFPHKSWQEVTKIIGRQIANTKK